MPRRRNRRKRNGKAVHPMTAPTMNRMQQVNTWNLQDLVPMAASQNFDSNQPVVVEVFAGVNGWGYSLTQGNQSIGGDAKLYGDANQQFPELASLWSTYRLDSLMIEWSPSQIGAGYQSPIATCVDPAGATAAVGTNNFSDVVATFSRLRSFQLKTSLSKPSRVFQDYKSWLMQTTPQAFLQTVDPLSATGERVLYPQGNVSTNPVLRMAGVVVLGTLDSRTELGFLRVNARMSVRGRRGLPLPAPTQVAMMSREQQQQIVDYFNQQQAVKPPLRLPSTR